MPPSNSRSNSTFQEIMTNLKPSAAFVVMIFSALIAFEFFNYSTTDHALRDLLGDARFAGFYWSTILALAFCGIDFAGIARLFTPEQGADEPKEVWYLFGAWLLAATMNAILTWWGVSMAINGRTIQSSAIIDPKTLATIVPVFVAIMVWVIRILIIGTLSMAMDRVLHPGAHQRQVVQNVASNQYRSNRAQIPSNQQMSIPASLNSAGISSRPSMSRSASASSRVARPSIPMDEPEYVPENSARSTREPTYHSLSINARQAANNNSRGGSTDPRYSR